MIESELKVAMVELKNNMYEQQFGFERQIANIVNILSQEVK